jgi:P-type Ca2+ transporter type 2C
VLSFTAEGEGLSNSLTVRHCCPGRIRVYVDGLRRSPHVALMLESGLIAHPCVRYARASQLTGNVTVQFDKDLASDRILQRIGRLLRRKLVGCHRGAAIESNCEWHKASAEEICSRFETDPARGLSQKTAQKRLAVVGPNALKPATERSAVQMLAAQFCTLPVAVLAGAAIVSLCTGAILEAVAITAVLGLNGTIGYLTDAYADATIRSLSASGFRSARVLRDGAVKNIPEPEVVPGDILLFRRNTVVAADARLVSAHGISVAESALTGESLPVSKAISPLDGERIPLSARTNMVYRGTLVTGGDGAAVVVATGGETEVGRVQRLVEASQPPETPTYRQLCVLGSRLAWLTGGASLLLFLFGAMRGLGLWHMMRSALSLAVASVPEGLPMVATTAHALGVNALRRRDIHVRRLDAIETLAAVDVICLDKTGTLTENRMSVAALLLGTRISPARQQAVPPGVADTGRHREDQRLRKLLETACLCSDIELKGNGARPELEGSSTETALVEYAMDNGLDVIEARLLSPRIATHQRTEAYRFMATVHERPGGRLIAMKGNPVEVLARCSTEATRRGGRLPITPHRRAAIERLNSRMAGRGLRVLGFAFRDLPAGAGFNSSEQAMTWVGAIGLADPIRPGLQAVVHRLHAAGIRTVMLTGDQCPTAQAVADEIRLAEHGHARLLDASDVEQLDTGELAQAAACVEAFARITPAQKLKIVQALQESGSVVAMIGDGINDSPALRASDVGLAMSLRGDAAAREVADVFLQTDQLACVVDAIERARTIRTNVRKSLRFLIGTNSSEVLLMLGAAAGGLGEALNPMQLLWINLITDVLPGIGLTFEASDPDAMRQPPESKERPLLGDKQIVMLLGDGASLGTGALAAGLYGAFRFGANSAGMQTLMFGSLVASQLQHTLTCRAMPGQRRSPASNGLLMSILAGSFAVQGAAFLIPALRRALRLAPIGLGGWAAIALSGVVPLLTRDFFSGARWHGTASPDTARSADSVSCGSVGRQGFVDQPETTPASP